MSDTDVTAAVETTEEVVTATEVEKDWKAEAEKWKALSRKHEAEKKANADAARKLAEMEDADKSELQRLTERAAQAEAEASEARQTLLRQQIAADKGLSLAQSKWLTGSTREEMEIAADEIVAAFSPAADRHPGGKPVEDLKGGSDPASRPIETDPRKLAEMLRPSR